METLTAQNVPAADLEKLQEILTQLPAGSVLGRSIATLIGAVASGEDVVVGPAREQLTPARAAALLQMSRTHLYKVMDAGDLAYVRVGRDRRLALADVIAFDRRRQDERRALAERFAHADDLKRQRVQELVED